jgi:chromosome partitioning protein
VIITLCNQKGGAGKTTLTLLLAMALEDVGRSVAVVDRDPQLTSTRAIQHLNQAGLSQIQLVTEPGAYDVTFIDTAPRLDATLAASLGASDRIVLVSSPSPADLWSTQQSREFVLANIKPTAKKGVLFNSVVKGARISRDLEELAGHIGLPALRSCIIRRQCYQYAVLQGWSALRASERDEVKSAAIEIATM